MKTLLLIIGALAAAVSAGIFLEDDPGRFIISYGGVTVQTSFALFVILLVILILAVFLLLEFVRGLWRLPGNYRRWHEHRRRLRAENYLTHGCQALLEGDWRGAEESFRKGAAYSQMPMLNYLFAARAAQQQGQTKRRDTYLRLAHEFSPENSHAAELTQAELQLSQRQTEQAYATLKHLDTEGIDNDQVKLMLLDASSELMEWRQVLDLLDKLTSRNTLPRETIITRQLQAYAGLLEQAGQSGDKQALDGEWGRIPAKFRRELYLLEVYTMQCLQFQDESECEKLLRRTLGKSYDPAIVRLYGMVNSEDPAKQLSFAERLQKNHTSDPVLFLTLGRLCIRNRLWGKARTFLETSLSMAPAPEAYQELAALYEREGDPTKAAECYRAGLESATGQLLKASYTQLGPPSAGMSGLIGIQPRLPGT